MMNLEKLAAPALISVFLVVAGHTQAVKGIVKDTAGKALPYITVNLKSRAGNAILSYSTTDAKGSFTLRMQGNIARDSFYIEAHGFGYKTESKNLGSFDAGIDFILSETSDLLKEVIVKSNRPVLRTHGDTLGYKVSEFASPQDRTIGEVIKKMPGITVATDGTIRYNGKPISALYIGGDNLLDDKYSIATNTIPQGVVNQVQIIQNDQPIKALQNKILSEDIALNLEFKKDAKLHLIGQESIGVGAPGNYEVDLNAMMFRNNYKAINYLSGNNTGYNVQRELVSHNATDYQQRIDNAIPATILSLGTVNSPALSENRYLFNQSAVLNVNNLINLEKNVQLKVNAYYVHDWQRQDYSQRTSIFLPGDTVRYQEVQHNRSVPDIFHTQFTLNVNRNNYYLNDVLLMDQTKLMNYSALKTDSAVANQLFHDNTHNFSNEFNLIRTLASNRVIQVYSYISHSSEPQKLGIDPGYNTATFNNSMPYAALVQNVNIPSWYANHYFSFRIPSGLITQGYRAGFSVQSQKLVSELYILQNNNSTNLFSDSARNNLSWTKQKVYAEASYDLPGKIVQAKLVLPLTLQQINYSDASYGLSKSLARIFFNPQLNGKYQVGAENYFNFLYSYRNQVGTIENIYPGYILTNYRMLQANNSLLTEQKINQASGGFSYRKALTLFFWNINALYNHTSANNIVSSLVTQNVQKGIVLPYPNSSDSWTLTGSMSKYVFALRTTFSGYIQWNNARSVQIQNNARLPFNTVSETYNFSADTKLNDRVNFSYKTTLTQIRSHSSVSSSAYKINGLVQQASVNYEPVDNIQFKISGEHYFTRQLGNPDLQYFFADAYLKFKVSKWKTDFELSAVNFLNVKTYDALYLSANTFTASSYTLPGRIVMMKIRFNF